MKGRVLPIRSTKTKQSQPTRAEIEEQVAAYLKRGGQIKRLHAQPDGAKLLAEVSPLTDVKTSGLTENHLFQLSVSQEL
jgi:hypothetical protein